jgi:hypothetical protein
MKNVPKPSQHRPDLKATCRIGIGNHPPRFFFAVQDVRLRQGIEQSVGGGAVCKLSTGQEKSEWSAGNIKQRMNFRGATAVTVLRSPSSANEASACSGMMRTLGALDADPEGRTAPGCD